MLDKSVPYYNIIMKRCKGNLIQEVFLKKGFSFVNYKPGDENAWAKIETSVGEFDCIADSLSYFRSRYLPYQALLKERMLFIQNVKGEKIATFTIWWDEDDNNEIPSVNWVGVKPNYQGLGLGKAIIFKGLQESVQLLGDVDIYLHTQTWSYKAVGIYEKAGFGILKEGSFGRYKNEYYQAKPILDKMMKVGVK